MQKHIVQGMIRLPEKEKQKELYSQLGNFADWMKRTKDENEIRSDKQRSVPVEMLPMVF